MVLPIGASLISTLAEEDERNSSRLLPQDNYQHQEDHENHVVDDDNPPNELDEPSQRHANDGDDESVPTADISLYYHSVATSDSTPPCRNPQPLYERRRHMGAGGSTTLSSLSSGTARQQRGDGGADDTTTTTFRSNQQHSNSTVTTGSELRVEDASTAVTAPPNRRKYHSYHHGEGDGSSNTLATNNNKTVRHSEPGSNATIARLPPIFEINVPHPPPQNNAHNNPNNPSTTTTTGPIVFVPHRAVAGQDQQQQQHNANNNNNNKEYPPFPTVLLAIHEVAVLVTIGFVTDTVVSKKDGKYWIYGICFVWYTILYLATRYMMQWKCAAVTLSSNTTTINSSPPAWIHGRGYPMAIFVLLLVMTVVATCADKKKNEMIIFNLCFAAASTFVTWASVRLFHWGNNNDTNAREEATTSRETSFETQQRDDDTTNIHV